MNGYDVYALALIIPAMIGGGILTFCIFRDVNKAEEAAKKAEKVKHKHHGKERMGLVG